MTLPTMWPDDFYTFRMLIIKKPLTFGIFYGKRFFNNGRAELPLDRGGSAFLLLIVGILMLKSLFLLRSGPGMPNPKQEDSDLDPEKIKAELQTEDKQKRLRDLETWRRQARIRQSENRTEMAMDEDFYDSIQYDETDLAVLKDRNQAPLTFNVIKNVVNWILGTELKSRIDYRVLPRSKKWSAEAKVKTKTLKYVQDVSYGEFIRSQTFADCIRAGLGWMEVAVRANRDEPIFMRSESWRNVWFDHCGRDPLCSDWRYIFRERWVDLDIAQSMFPAWKQELQTEAEKVNTLYPFIPNEIALPDDASEWDVELEMSVLTGGVGESRERVKFVEGWYRMPEAIKKLEMRDPDTPFGALDGTIYRKDNPDHEYLVKGRYFSTVDAVEMVVRQAIWTGKTYLQDVLTPYNHNRFPFIPMFCYRRKRDGMPYGVVRDLRDPQSDLNKRRSRALAILSVNQMLYEKGAFDDVQKAHEEFQRVDGMVEVQDGKLGAVQIRKDIAMAKGHVELAKDDELFIYKSAGVTQENVGEVKKDLSGKAIGKLQEQGQTGAGIFFDNYYFAFQYAGEILCSLTEQFFDTEKEILVTGDQTSKDEFVTINEWTDDGIRNSITREKGRFVVSKQDFRETIRLSMFQMMSELVQQLSQSMPQVALALLDLVVEYMDALPGKEEMARRIREINKQQAPDEDLSEEEKAKVEQDKQAMAAQQQAMQQIQQAMIQAELAIKQADASGKMAQAIKTHVDTKLQELTGYLKALEVAGAINMSPGLVRAADSLIGESQGAMNGNGRRRMLTQRPEQVPQQIQ